LKKKKESIELRKTLPCNTRNAGPGRKKDFVKKKESSSSKKIVNLVVTGNTK